MENVNLRKLEKFKFDFESLRFQVVFSKTFNNSFSVIFIITFIYRLQLVDQAQEEEKEYLAILTAEQRKEDAEKAFRKWMNRKHSIMLQEAANELEEAKIKRENTEKKLKLRRALLRAKVLCKLSDVAVNFCSRFVLLNGAKKKTNCFNNYFFSSETFKNHLILILSEAWRHHFGVGVIFAKLESPIWHV